MKPCCVIHTIMKKISLINEPKHFAVYPPARDQQDAERLKSVVSKICSTYFNVTHSIYIIVYKVYAIHFNIHFLLISEHKMDFVLQKV